MKTFFDPAVYESPILSLSAEETKNAYHIILLAPGLNRKDISVFVGGNKVIITNKKQSTGHPLREPEYSFSTFSKSFTTLNKIDPDRIRLTYKNNIITVKLMKQPDCRELPPTLSSSHPVFAEI